jgi:hypothetical protein
MPLIWVEIGMINYVAGSFFIVPRLIKLCTDRFLGLPYGVIVGADRPNIKMILGFAGAIATTLLLYLYLAVWQLPLKFGIEGTAWIIELGGLPVAVITSFIAYWYVHTKIVEIIIPWKQILLGTIFPAVVSYFLLRIVLNFIFYPFFELWGIIPAIIGTVPFLFSIVFFLYFPLTAILGAWDAINLDEFKKAAEMSGPSKFLVMPLYKILVYFSKKSKLHDKFGMDATSVLREAEELYLLKVENRDIMRKTM